MIEDVDPEKLRLPPVWPGLLALQTTPIALTVTPRPLESAKGSLLLAALRWTRVPETTLIGMFIDGNARYRAALVTRKLESSPFKTFVVVSPPIVNDVADKAEKLAVLGTALYATALPLTNHPMCAPLRMTTMWCQTPKTAVHEPRTQPVERQSADVPLVCSSTASVEAALIANGRVAAELWALTKNSSVKSAVSSAAATGGTTMTAQRATNRSEEACGEERAQITHCLTWIH